MKNPPPAVWVRAISPNSWFAHCRPPLWIAVFVFAGVMLRASGAENAILTGETWDMVVQVSGTHSTSGTLAILVFAEKKGFPADSSKAIRKGFFPIAESASSPTLVVFQGLRPQKTYAISVYHDQNNNLRLDRNFFGVPQEQVGFSRNPRLGFGPPDFSQASFVLIENGQTIPIRLNPVPH